MPTKAEEKRKGSVRNCGQSISYKGGGNGESLIERKVRILPTRAAGRVKGYELRSEYRLQRRRERREVRN